MQYKSVFFRTRRLYDADGAALARYGHLPTPEETALLQAALRGAPLPAKLLRPEMPRLDPGVARLLPMLHGHPGLVSAPPALRQLVADERRRAAQRHIALKASLHTVLGLLEPAGIEALLLKGFPLASLYYPDIGRRPMADLDVCVRPERFDETVALLLAGGFHPYDPQAPGVAPPVPTADGLRSHAAGFADRHGVELDLHRQVLMCAAWPGADDGFWAEARPLRVADRSASTLCAADHLLHACLHGVVRNPVSPVRWVADVVHIVERSPGGVDWPLLCDRARAIDCRGPLLAALRHAHEAHGCAIPGEALAALARVPFTRVSDRWFRIAGRRAPPETALRRRAARLILDYRRDNRGRGRRMATPAGLVRYFMTKWRIDDCRRLPREILARCRPRSR
jgi:hypothetical protein